MIVLLEGLNKNLKKLMSSRLLLDKTADLGDH